MRQFLVLLIATLLVPTIGAVSALVPYWDGLGMRDVPRAGSVAFGCLTSSSLTGEAAQLCEALAPFNWLGAGAIAVGGVGLAIVLVVLLSSFLTGWSRVLLALSFPVVSFLALLGVGFVLLGQAALASASAYLMEAYFFDTVHPAVIGVVAIAGGLLSLSIFINALRLFSGAKTSVIGVPVNPIDAPHIHRTVANIARHLNTKPPRNIVLGLDPNFFATSARVLTPFQKRPLSGDTLYLSLPLLRVLSEGETRSIIGHELAHFSGGDTLYSQRFAPAYYGLSRARSDLHDQDRQASPFALPAIVMIDFILSAFGKWERRISRQRELRADKLGSEVGSPLELSRALVKVSLLSQIWHLEFESMITRVRQGRFSRNLSKNFVERARFDVDHDKIAGLAALGLDTETSHPTDSHPLTRERIEALGVEPEPLVESEQFKAALFPTQTLIAKADSIERVEEMLTEMYQHYVLSYSQMPISDQDKDRNAFANLLSMLLSKMVHADGVVDDREIETALRQASGYGDLFDPVAFREFCRHPEDIPSTEKLIYWGNMMMTPTGVDRLKVVLRAIAEADNSFHIKESELLAEIEEGLVGGE